MLVSLIGGGMLLAILIFLIVGSLWFEEHIWNGLKFNWRLMFPGYREAARQKGIVERLKVFSDGQDTMLEATRKTRDILYHKLYDTDGLVDQVADLKKVLEWTRTSLNEERQEVLKQRGFVRELRECLNVSEHVRADQGAELRKRATTIRQLKGIPARKRK